MSTRPATSLDPKLEAILKSTAEAGRKPFRTGTAHQARDAMAARAQPGTRAMHDIADADVTAFGRSWGVRVYSPSAEASSVVVYFHGGGWVMGSIESADAVARELAHQTQAHVVSVDYSLAPDHRPPAQAEEAAESVRWAAARFPGQPVAVAGESSGGNLAIVAARTLAAEGETTVVGLGLFYPPVDGTTFDETSQAGDVPLLVDDEDMRWFWEQYAPNLDDRESPDVSPIRATDLAELPPTVIALCGHDPVRSEDDEFVGLLQGAGVEVEAHPFEPMCHGFLAFLGPVPQAAEAIELIGTGLRRHLQNRQP